MRYTIVPSNEFNRQRERLRYSGRVRLMKKLNATIELLAKGEPLPPSARNHKLAGNLAEFYECHIEPDWLLMYAIKKEKLILVLAATGTHSQLFD